MQPFGHTEDGIDLPIQWYGDEDSAALVDLSTGHVLGQFAHDGHGKYHIWLYATLWRAWWILRNAPGGIASWSPFPRICVWLLRVKDEDQARAEIEVFSGVVQIPDKPEI